MFARTGSHLIITYWIRPLIKQRRIYLSTDHFSQLVWRNSKELGIGTAQSKSGNFFLVARYSPPGNINGEFSDNVPAVEEQFSDEGRQEDSNNDINLGKIGKLGNILQFIKTLFTFITESPLQKREGTWLELTFAKTSGTVAMGRGKLANS